MKNEILSFTDSLNTSISYLKWSPETKAKAILLLAHGIGEHVERYERLATALTAKGYLVYAIEHRGHGRTAAHTEGLGRIGHGARHMALVDDLAELSDIVSKENPGLKLFLLGHSMGSFIAQGFIARYGKRLSGCVLSATAGRYGPILLVGRTLSALGCVFKGEDALSPMIDAMSLGSLNEPFKPNRTAKDWLSRDNAEVDKYIADPLCGFVSSFGFFRAFFGLLAYIHKPAVMAGIPKDLPIYMFGGSKDPVGVISGSFASLAAEYRALGISDLTQKLYPEARHETLNETNREEVMKDLIAWLEKRA